MKHAEGDVVYLRARVSRVNHRGFVELHPIDDQLEYQSPGFMPGATIVDPACIVDSPIQQTAPRPVVMYAGKVFNPERKMA